ncbi:MAG: dNTP triphosphohydrolase [Gemmatimonadaceae bacterium]|nr:dNTP triphosphohydrolase [Gemmatimonadaceae bacterium]
MASWAQLLNRKRLRDGAPAESGDEGNDFLSDYYRVVFSSSFRRLQDKTQVSPLAATDFVRRRLTHSVEVAVVGERMGRVVAKKLAGEIGVEDSVESFGRIVASACLLHDIGNPPFGHEGELAIRRWADKVGAPADQRCFDGNAQGFRIATRLQHHGKPYGLNLTTACLAATLKYPSTPSLSNIPEDGSLRNRGKWSVMSSERPAYEAVAESVGLEVGQRHPLSYLVEAADDIVNRLVDIEDAIKLKLVSYEEMRGVLENEGGSKSKELLREMDLRLSACAGSSQSEKELRAYQHFRVHATTAFAKACENEFISRIDALCSGKQTGELIKESSLAGLYAAIKKLEDSKIFGDPAIVRVEAGGKKAIEGLLDAFHDEVRLGSKLGATVPEPLMWEGSFSEDSEASNIRRVVDYVSGMTDRYAVDLYQKLSGVSL